MTYILIFVTVFASFNQKSVVQKIL